MKLWSKFATCSSAYRRKIMNGFSSENDLSVSDLLFDGDMLVRTW